MRFLEPLAAAMTRVNPKERPSAAEALKTFRDIANRLKGSARRWRLQSVEERFAARIYRDFFAVLREATYLARRREGK